MPLSASDAYRMAQEYFGHWLSSADEFYDNFEFNLERGRLNNAAFQLHQTAERLYICFLLVRTLYFPRSHNIKFLRSLSEDKEPRLVAAWPRETKLERARFERLKRAYVEARYSPHYEIGDEELRWLGSRVADLQALVKTVCEERLATES